MKKCRKNKGAPITDGVARAQEVVMQPQQGPFPMAQAAAPAMAMPNCGAFQVQANGMPMGLPVYTSVDEYGRVYNPIVHYGPQTHSAPVPVAKAPAFVQLAPIVSPVAFIPYSGQEQDMYQVEDDK